MAIKRTTRKIDLEKKYDLYERSVQNVEADVDFILKTWRSRHGKKLPGILREDFCGTGALMCEWAKQGANFYAHGLDVDPVPMDYGKKHHLSKLSSSEQARVFYHKQDVLRAQKFKADIITAFNFSYFFFKERELLKMYFVSVRESLPPGGMFFIDLFGGTDCYKVLEEKTRHPKHIYYWDCQKFNPVNHHCFYAIHFSEKETKYLDVFTYDWRHWTLPELIDLMLDAGFKKPTCYWEGEEADGSGNGEFSPAGEEENSPSWIAYLVGER